MTGEISLRGLVLPVGGIKQKVVAAHSAGIRRVLLPARNRRDHEEIPQGAREGDRKSTRLNSSHANISYAVFCLKKNKNDIHHRSGILHLDLKLANVLSMAHNTPKVTDVCLAHQVRYNGDLWNTRLNSNHTNH